VVAEPDQVVEDRGAVAVVDTRQQESHLGPPGVAEKPDPVGVDDLQGAQVLAHPERHVDPEPDQGEPVPEEAAADPLFFAAAAHEPEARKGDDEPAADEPSDQLGAGEPPRAAAVAVDRRDRRGSGAERGSGPPPGRGARRRAR